MPCTTQGQAGRHRRADDRLGVVGSGGQESAPLSAPRSRFIPQSCLRHESLKGKRRTKTCHQQAAESTAFVFLSCLRFAGFVWRTSFLSPAISRASR